MSEDFAKQVKDLLEVARAHVATVAGLSQEMVEGCDRPGTQVYSIRALAWDATEKLEDINRLIDDACPKPGELDAQFEAGFMSALRSLQAGAKGPKGQGPISREAGIALHQTLQAMRQHFAEAAATDATSLPV
jgi:hypothetical protein